MMFDGFNILYIYIMYIYLLSNDGWVPSKVILMVIWVNTVVIYDLVKSYGDHGKIFSIAST